MKLPAIILTMAAMCFAATASAGCDYPKQPRDLPNGKSEGKEEMLAAQQQVKAYVAEMEGYLKCLDDELNAMGEDVTEEHILIRDKRHNAAIDAMDAVASSFNTAVRAYKERQ